MPGADALYAAAAGRGDLFQTAIEPNYSPLGGMFGDNPMMGMLLQFGMQHMFGGSGFLGGQFLPTQNLYRQVQAQQFQASRMAALQAGFQADRPGYARMMGGLAQMTGTPFGLEQARAANVMAGDMAAIMPFIAPMAPGTFDQMHGSAGSRGLLADTIFRRGLHDIDPFSGAVGLSPESAAGRASHVFRQLYESGAPGSGIAAMRGLGAGSAGQIYAEMQRMGMGGPQTGLDRHLVRDASALEGMMPGVGREVLQNFDAGRVTKSVKGMAGAVSAMKDIFGDAGHPDAPIPVLIKALNDLTQGGLANLTPDKLETMVRTSAATAKRAGVTMDALAGSMAQSASFAASRGLDRGFGADAATRSLSFGAAMGDVGRLDAAAFGRMSKAEYTVKDSQLRVQAAASPIANQLAAMLRFEDEAGGKLNGQAAQITAAVRAGKPVEHMTPTELLAVMTSGGMSANMAQQMIEAKGQNQGYVQKYEIGNTVRGSQVGEVRGLATQSFQGVIQGRLMAQGVSQAEASRQAEKMAGAAGTYLFDPNGDQNRRAILADDASRRTHLARSMAGAVGIDYDKLKPDDPRRQQFDEMATAGFGQFGIESERRLGLRGQAAIDAFNPLVLKQERARHAAAQQDAAMEKAMSSLGRAGPMARLVDTIKDPILGADGKMDMAASVAKFLGGITGKDLGGALDKAASTAQLQGGAASTRMLALAQGVQSSQQAFEAARARGASPAEIAEITGEITALASGGADANKSLAALMKRSGLQPGDVDDVLSGKKDVDAGLRHRVRGLVAAGKAGMNETAEANGINTRSQVTAEDATTAHDQLARVHDLRQQAARTKDPKEKARLLDLAQKVHAAGFHQAKALADAALGTEGSVAALGKGGQDVAERARNAALGMEALAKQQGKTVEELMTSTAGLDTAEGQAAQDMRSKSGSLELAVKEMQDRIGDKRNNDYKLDPDTEKKKFAELHKSEGGDPTKRNIDKLKQIIGRVHGGSLSDEKLKELSKMVGGGEMGDVNLKRLEQAAEAYEKLEKGGGSDAEREFLAKQAGAFAQIGETGPGSKHVGKDAATTAKALTEQLKPESQDKKESITFNGKVTIDSDGKIDFSKAFGTRTTPTATA